QARAGRARGGAGAAPPWPAAVRSAVALGPPGPPFPWSPRFVRLRSAPAPPLPAAMGMPPELQVLASTVSDGKRHLRLRLVSRRGAPVGTLLVPARAKPDEVEIEGHRLSAAGRRGGRGPQGGFEWLAYSGSTLPAAGGLRWPGRQRQHAAGCGVRDRPRAAGDRAARRLCAGPDARPARHRLRPARGAATLRPAVPGRRRDGDQPQGEDLK